MRVLIIGPGYVGCETARLLISLGHDVFTLGRSGKRPELAELRVESICGDITNPESLKTLPRNWDWVVNCVSSSKGGVEDYRSVYLEGTRNLIRWLAPNPPKKYVYTSSTGVYGQSDGSIVTESSSTKPDSDTGRVLVETEELLMDTARLRRFPAVDLRVSGIYGPGRGYWLNQFLTGQAALDGDGSRILNMVHRDDVVGAILAALEYGEPGEVYNVSDDEPISQRDLFKWLSENLHRPMPAPSGDNESASGKRRPGSKRVSNAKLKAELGYRFKFPTFREGFRSLLPPTE
jgi:nucleoside-diphosphate-sugar epimerase